MTEEKEQQHWSKDLTLLRKFWAQAADAAGVTGKLLEAVVHRALSVAHLEEYDGALEDAVAAVADYAQEAVKWYAVRDVVAELRYAADNANKGDALGRLSWKVQGKSGADYLLTASMAGLSCEAIRQLHGELLAHLEAIEAGYPGHGFTLLADGRNSVPDNRPRTPHASQIRAEGGSEAVVAAIRRTTEVLTNAAAANAAKQAAAERGIEYDPVTPAVVVEQDGDAETATTASAVSDLVTFPLESVKVQATTNGKRYYQVFGGRWKKFGCKCWPEVFEAVFDAAGWPVGTEKPVDAGLTCYCEPNEKGNAPGKCIRIA